MTDRLVEILYLVSAGLLSPTLILLLAFIVSTLLMLGGLVREALDRWRVRSGWLRFLSELRSGNVDVSHLFLLPLQGFPARFQKESATICHRQKAVHKSLEDLEMSMTRGLCGLAFTTRLGPMLGLVGTLVPLGPALTGLASGDIQALSGNLVIAFTTTVFGILVGGFAYGAGLVRRNWYEQDLSDLEFIASHWDSISPNHDLTSDRADTVCGVGTSDLQFNRRSDVAVRHAATKDNPSANSDGHHA